MNNKIINNPSVHCGSKIINPDNYSVIVVKNIAERDSIPCITRQDGMIAIIVDDGYSQYQLRVNNQTDVCDNTNWFKIEEGDVVDETLLIYYFDNILQAEDFLSLHTIKNGNVFYINATNSYYKVVNNTLQSIGVLADEEDVTLLLNPNTNLNELKFKDRQYNSALKNGLGYKILRKNSDTPSLNQSDFIANTIHEIRYDFDLNGQVINIPSNVILKFNGGSISNGTLNGNNTKFDTDLVKIFNNISFSGTFDIVDTYPEWFGAISIPVNIDDELVNGIEDLDTKAIDSAEAIRKALELSGLSGHRCVLTKGAYKIKSTINLVNRNELFISNGAVVYPILHGSGKMVSSGNRVYAIKTNEYYPTESLAIAIRMDNTSKVSGRGWISLRLSDFTIGIYLTASPFGWADMTWSPSCDVRIVGGGTWSTFPEASTIMGSGIPSSSIGVDGDWYFDTNSYETTERGQIYSKSAGVWNAGGVSVCLGNTSLRVESNLNDYRIISMDMSVWDIYGSRGIEIIAVNGGWINDSRWKGTVSNKTNNFVSFFGAGAKLQHDMSAMDYQTDNFMSYDCRIVYAEGDTGQNEFGYTWDLEFMSNIRNPIKYEFTQGTYLNRFISESDIKPRFISDSGNQNLFGFNDNTKVIYSPNNVAGEFYKDLFGASMPYGDLFTQKATGGFVPRTYKFPELIRDLNLIRTRTLAEPISIQNYPKKMFDGNITSYDTVIKTSSNLFGTSFVIGHADGGPLQYLNYLQVSYDLTVTSNNRKIRLVVTDGDNKVINSVYLQPSTRGNQFYIKEGNIAIPVLSNNPNLNVIVAFYVDDDSTDPVELRIHTMKFLSNATYIDTFVDKNIGWAVTPLNRSSIQEVEGYSILPNAAESGYKFFLKGGKRQLTNFGDSDNQIWKEEHAESFRFFNIFKHRTPDTLPYPVFHPDLNRIVKFNAPTTASDIVTKGTDTAVTGVPFNPVLFDGLPNTKDTVIDVANGLYGVSIPLGHNVDLGIDYGYIVIEYNINDGEHPDSNPNVNVVVSDYKTFGDNYNIIPIKNDIINADSKEWYSGFGSQTGYTRKVIPIKTGTQAWVVLGFYTDATANCKLEIHNISLFVDNKNQYSIPSNKFGTTQRIPNAAPAGESYYDTTLSEYKVNVGNSVTPIWKGLPSSESGSWVIPTTPVIGNTICSYSKVDKQVILSGTSAFFQPNVDVNIVLPFAPDYGMAYICGELTITTQTGSTNAIIKCSVQGYDKTFQINFKTI